MVIGLYFAGSFESPPLGIRIVSPFTNRSCVNPAKSHRLYAAASIAGETDFRSFRVIISEPDALSSESCNAFATSPMETGSTMDQSSRLYFENRSLSRLRSFEQGSPKGLLFFQIQFQMSSSPAPTSPPGSFLHTFFGLTERLPVP